jgi:RNA polymerase sigma factor (sigma-70 family)
MPFTNSAEVTTILKSNNPSRVIQWLYDDLYPKIRAYVTTNSGQESDAEDIFQEALMKLLLYAKTDRLKPDANIEGFVYIICTNAWKSKSKKSSKVSFVELHHETTMVDEEVEDFEEEKMEQVNSLTHCLQLVGENCKKLLQLINYEKLSHKEVALAMDYSSVNAVKTRHYKCKKKLLKIMNEA